MHHNDSDQAERAIDMQMTVVAYNQTAAIVHPAKAPFDLPALLAGLPNSGRAAAFRFLAPAPLESRDGGLDATPAQRVTRLSTVVGFVRDQFFRAGLGPTPLLGHFNRA